MHHPTDRITHTTAFVTPVVEHWLEREIAQWVQSGVGWDLNKNYSSAGIRLEAFVSEAIQDNPRSGLTFIRKYQQF